jgi:hypothetical protein
MGANALRHDVAQDLGAVRYSRVETRAPAHASETFPSRPARTGALENGPRAPSLRKWPPVAGIGLMLATSAAFWAAVAFALFRL